MRGGADPLFTWQQGLDRIVLGWMLPDNGELWQNHAPWHTDPAVIPLLARLAAFLRRLARWRQTWQTPATVAVWTQRITDMLQDLFVQDNQARQDMQQLAQALARWRQETELARFGGELDCSVINRHLARYLGSRSEAGFLRGGITFCSMVPMRSLPFQTLCLLGLNDGQFPRNTRAAAFDLIARHPRRGDRARRAAHKADYTAYFANKAGTPQADYPEVAQVFGRNNTPPIDEDPFWLLAEHLAHLLAATEQTEQTPPP